MLVFYIKLVQKSLIDIKFLYIYRYELLNKPSKKGKYESATDR